MRRDSTKKILDYAPASSRRVFPSCWIAAVRHRSGCLMLDSDIENREPRIENRLTRRVRAFALYEVLMGVAIFAFGVLALGRAVDNCLNASALNAEENRVRLILANRMAEVQTTPGVPDQSREFTVDTGYGKVQLTQTS